MLFTQYIINLLIILSQNYSGYQKEITCIFPPIFPAYSSGLFICQLCNPLLECTGQPHLLDAGDIISLDQLLEREPMLYLDEIISRLEETWHTSVCLSCYFTMHSYLTWSHQKTVSKQAQEWSDYLHTVWEGLNMMTPAIFYFIGFIISQQFVWGAIANKLRWEEMVVKEGPRQASFILFHNSLGGFRREVELLCTILQHVWHVLPNSKIQRPGGCIEDRQGWCTK